MSNNKNICCECINKNRFVVKKHPLLDIYICLNCKENLFKYQTVTTEEAKKLYGISKNELKNKYINNVQNDIYLVKDICQIKKSKNNDILLRYKKRQFKRNQLFIKHNIPSKDNINYNLWNYVIEDFFDYSVATPKIHINTIIERANAAVILTNLNIVKNACLIYYFVKNKDKNSHPYLIIQEAIELSKVKKKVFDIQMENILSYLEPCDLANWSKSY
jgi:hypothetical protein